MIGSVRSRAATVLALLIATVSVVALAASAASASPAARAHAAGGCSVGSGRGLGYTYVTFLWVYKTSCASGRSIVKHHGHVHGWSCKRKVLDRSPVQYDAKMTCKSGRRQVQWTFTQNT